MNHRFTNDERSFAEDNIADGHEIVEQEQDLGRETTCIDVRLTVVALDTISGIVAVLLLVSAVFMQQRDQPLFPLMLTQESVAVIAHAIAVAAAIRRVSGLLLFAMLLNVVQVALCLSRVCLTLQRGEVLQRASPPLVLTVAAMLFAGSEALVALIFLLIELLSDVVLIAFKGMLVLRLGKKQ